MPEEGRGSREGLSVYLLADEKNPMQTVFTRYMYT